MRILRASIDITDAACFHVVQNETLVARTHKTAKGIGAMTILTYILMFLALVNVFQYDSDTVWPIAHTTRAEFLEFFRPWLGTFFATITPSDTNAATTRCLCY